jgi:TetR/AcrR family transcriptional regulator of autoinduction and epiphytic fitness
MRQRRKDEAPAVPARIDGRKARAHRTRSAILGALLDLIDRGTLQPTASEVAAQAGVALRSIRQHFESREALFLAASERHGERIAHEHESSEREIATDGPLDERVRRFVEARARALEATSAIRRAAILRESSSAALSMALRTPARERRREVERVFAIELSLREPRERTSVLDALDLVTNGKAWDTLRRDMARSRAEAERVMATAIYALATLAK